MSDLVPSPVEAGAALVATKALLSLGRVLGPSMDVFGDSFRRWSELRTRNVGNIASKAEVKIGPEPDSDASVPPRVAAAVLERGSWCDDEVMQEYLAGILAGSRGRDGGDDRGVYWADLVARMASRYVQVHYLIYRALRDHGQVGGTGLTQLEGQRQRSVYLPFDGLSAALGVEAGRGREVAHQCMPVLAREGLIGGEWGSGPAEFLRFAGVPADGLQAVPTHAGVELFLWAHGRPATDLDVLMRQDFDLPDFGEHLGPVAGAQVGPILS